MNRKALKQDVCTPETSTATLDRPDPNGDIGYLQLRDGRYKLVSVSWPLPLPRPTHVGIDLSAPAKEFVLGTFKLVEDSNSDRVLETVFKGHRLEASIYGQRVWFEIKDYFQLLVSLAERTYPRLDVERLLAGEIVRIGEVWIRKIPEAKHVGL